MGEAATRLGEVLNDAYELHELVSSSGDFEIYRGTDRRTRSGVLIKLLRPEVALRSGVVEGFLRGPRSLSEVSHASLPAVHVDTDDTGIPFVVEETVEGRTLATLIESFPQGLPVQMLEQLAVPLTEALALAHSHGMVHGALDASHVLLVGPTHAPAPKLIGLGAVAEDRVAQDVAYRAPELTNEDEPDARSDVFALGVLLYQMLCGELPYRSGKKSAVPLDEIAPHLPPAWVGLTSACLEALPERRLGNANKLLTLLRGCASAASAKAGPAESERKSAPRVKEDARQAAPKPQPAVAKPSPQHDAERGAGALSMAATMLAMQAPIVPKRDELGFDVESFEEATQAEDIVASIEAKQAREPRPDAKAEQEAAQRDQAAKEAQAAQEAKSAQEAKDKKKQAAKEAGEKLNAKTKAARGPAREDAKDKDAKDKDAKLAKLAKPEPRKSAEPAEPRKSAVPAEPRKRPEPAARPTGAAKGAGPTQGQIAAAALTDAQLDALRAMRENNTEERDRWVGLFFIVLFLVLLQLGVPLLYETQMTRAHELFGARTKVVGAAFAVFTLIVTVRVWAAQFKGGSIIQKVTSYTMQIVAASIVVLTLTLYSQSPSLAMFAGMARKGLPWAVSFLYFLFAFDFGIRGAGQIANSMFYGAVVLLLSCGNLFGAYNALFHTLLKDRKQAAAALQQARTRDAANIDTTTGDTIDSIKKQLSDKTSMTDWQEKNSDVNTLQQRKEIGANEEDDLRATDELRDTRSKNKAALERLQQAMPAPNDPTTGAPLTQ
jgi:serine/threonine protein kinase